MQSSVSGLQRSGAKITFPYIWANTCCSHPLHVSSETETHNAMGVKNAARRKLEHELGIPPEDVPLDCFTWITRVHYVGASEGGEGSGAPVWGEHEIDWILMCTPPKMPRMNLNVNEVAQVRAFSQVELKEWMSTLEERGEAVSPWFGVMEKSLVYKCVHPHLTYRHLYAFQACNYLLQVVGCRVIASIGHRFGTRCHPQATRSRKHGAGQAHQHAHCICSHSGCNHGRRSRAILRY
jgi:isopentenyl-diphosphate delta-isomerase type 1